MKGEKREDGWRQASWNAKEQRVGGEMGGGRECCEGQMHAGKERERGGGPGEHPRFEVKSGKAVAGGNGLPQIRLQMRVLLAIRRQ